jgi:putative heme-binding domain-containing protein
VALVAGVWAAAAAHQMPFGAVDWDDGPYIFLEHCASCHSVDASGDRRYGPNLANLGLEAGARVSGLSAEEYVLQSMSDPAAFLTPGWHDPMPQTAAARLSPSAAVNVAAYLLSLGSTPDFRRLLRLRDSLALPAPASGHAPDLATIEAGRKLFFTKGDCLKCHALRELPGAGFQAPELRGVGRFGEEFLRESIEHPSRQIRTGYENWNIRLENGDTVLGRLLEKTDSHYRLLTFDFAGNLEVVEIQISTIARDAQGEPDARVSKVSAMPDEIDLSEPEIAAIVSYLSTL